MPSQGRNVLLKGLKQCKAAAWPGSRRIAAQAASPADLPGNLKNIVGAFQAVPDAMARYKQLLYFASKLEGLEESNKVEKNKVQVCTLLVPASFP